MRNQAGDELLKKHMRNLGKATYPQIYAETRKTAHNIGNLCKRIQKLIDLGQIVYSEENGIGYFSLK